MSTFLSESIQSVISRFHGQPRERRGDRSDRYWWPCPFHEDSNPSLCVQPGESHFQCFGCGAHGDSIDFVRRLNPRFSFSEALQSIQGRFPNSLGRERGSPVARTAHEPTSRPEGWREFAREIVDEAENRLWSDQGAPARDNLARRGLNEETIRKARLGFSPEDRWISGIFPDKSIWVPKGIVIPWLDSGDPGLVNVRRPIGDPKYVAIRGSRRGGIYPCRSEIASGKPLIIVEGELDALLLGQELREVASVVTLGSAGSRPSTLILGAMLRAHPWIIAGDADAAGERSAEGWMALSDRCIRISPPRGQGKDWSDAHRSGLNLRDHWVTTIQRLADESGLSREPIESEPTLPMEPFEDDEDFVDLGPFRPGSNRWRCLGRYCLKKGRWWMSEYGVVRCMNCQPPSFPCFVIAEGDAMNAPIVEPDCSCQAVAWPGSAVRDGQSNPHLEPRSSSSANSTSSPV